MNKDLKEKFAFTLAEGATHVGIFHNIGGTFHKLVESFTHVGIFNNTRRVGFTLAEVLITLGIIGIVSAMTIPTLLNNYRQKVLDKQFVQTYSLLSQNLLLTQSQYDYIPKCYYGGNGIQTNASNCPEFFNKFFNNLKVIKKCKNKAFESGCIPEYEGIDTVAEKNNPNAVVPDGYDSYGEYASRGCDCFKKNHILNNLPAYNLNNGSIVFLFSDGYYYAPIFTFDVNGHQGPNKWGHDLFNIGIYFDGNKFYLNDHVCMTTEDNGIKTLNKLQQLGLR